MNLSDQDREWYTKHTLDVYQLLRAWWLNGLIGNGKLPTNTLVPNRIDNLLVHFFGYEAIDEFIRKCSADEINRAYERLNGPNGFVFYKAILAQRS